MSDACAEAKAQLDRADTRLSAASALVATLRSEQGSLSSASADVERRFNDGAGSAAALDAAHQAAIEDRSAKRGPMQSANEALSAAKAELAAALAETNPITGTRLISAQNALPGAQEAAATATAAFEAAEAEIPLAAARAAKATAYLQTVANEREGVRTRTVTCDAQLELAVADESSASSARATAAAAVTANCP